MTTMRLLPSDTLLIGGKQYRVKERLENGAILLVAIATGGQTVMTDADLESLLVAGDLRIVPVADYTASAADASAALQEEFDTLPPKAKQEARRRHHYLAGLQRLGLLARLVPEKWTEAIVSLATEQGDPSPPSWRSVHRWHKRAGDDLDLRRLVDRDGRKGNRRPRLDPLVSAIIMGVVEDRYLSPERPSAVSLLSEIHARIKRENEVRSVENRLPVPHVSAVHRAIAGLDRREIVAARHGKRAAAHEFDPVTRTVTPEFPLALVEMDHTKLDLFVIDDKTHLPLGRPWLTLAVDKFSRMIVGAYLGFHDPSVHSVMQCLRNAILPKTWLKAKFPAIVNDWPCHGIPFELSLDRGMDFLSEDLADFCASAGINIRHAPSRAGWYKGSVERHFGTINKNFLHRLPGTSFSNIVERGEYDPSKNAVISFDEVQLMLYKWIVDVFSRSIHKGLNDIPVEVWERGCRDHPVRPVRHISDLDAILGRGESRMLRRTGIEFKNLHYMCPEVVAWRHDPAFVERSPDGKVDFKYDPSDLGAIRVLDPRTSRYVTVPVVHAEANYAVGLSEWQHDVISTYVRKQLQRRVDLDGLVEAKCFISGMVDGLIHTRKRGTKTAQTAAKWKRIGSHEPGLMDEKVADRPGRVSRLALPSPVVDAEFEDLAEEVPPSPPPKHTTRPASQNSQPSGRRHQTPPPLEPAGEDDIYAELGITGTRSADEFLAHRRNVR